MKNKGEVLASILLDFKDCYFFLHNTKEFNVVESIMNEGFVFESQLSHSTDRVNPNEPIEVTYFLFQRKDYGTYTIIIAIPKIIYEIYTSVSNEYDTGAEDIMTINDPIVSDNDELIYTISPRHILGYFNQKTLEFYQNRNWDPFFNNCQHRTPGRKIRKPGIK
ncbi:MAG: hypothetical protein A2X05_07600 [Bacteroidetes bacterium GWE2_41_25]|nr:MAG: hypothetical protein A2X03_05680 [Bacteroidetes bacterium GWA2_40_15]OFX89694.1 MAG: hypothetical protein A2X06_09590 [Bacteroidetes bacterium GWC2_40_22]OFY00679.1 MAG: hypothetical protein A2X05_07600 [Bacteroidetes bacterium GWE2_41_25]OFY61311.1 MAG: hypothetical protein A2X04_09170 [Bacteroidetes bacterium GWF2_41_9]HAM11428.1 hypothetical protein [Bacteroidales bacterium]